MSDDDQIVLFQRAGRGFPRGAVRTVAGEIRDQVAGGRSFVCLLTDDRELGRLNRTFLGNDYATDVLAFPDEAAMTDRGAPLGEVAISADRARAQAGERGHSVEAEIGILMLHGVLHLLGMDHETDRGRMARTEKRWRQGLGLPDGLIERSGR